MQANYVQRLRIVFGKTGQTRFIGHLDVARTLERALNRAKIPLAYTQGFNRRPRMQLAAALPLGFTSECEIADIWLVEQLDPDTAYQHLSQTMPSGIEIYNVTEVSVKEPPLQTVTNEASYEIVIREQVDRAILQNRIDELILSKQILRERRGKSYDLRPALLDLELRDSQEGVIVLEIRLSLAPGKSGRPDEVLLALKLDPLAARIHRKALTLTTSAEDTEIV